MGKKIRIAALGDIAVLQKPKKDIWKGMMEQADICLANLEAPIVATPGPPADKMVRMKQPAETASWLNELHITAVSLANNHMLDWGIEGLQQTCRFLDEAGIRHTGAGNDLEQAAEPVFIEKEGFTIAFISWSSAVPPGFRAIKNRPGIASVRIKTSFHIDSSILDEQPGTPPWIQTIPVEEDLLLLEQAIKDAASKSDFVILAMHWGVPPQWSSVPQDPIAEYQKIVAQRVANAGVDVVIGHHSHAPYGLETYQAEKGEPKEVPILYSLGNYIFHPEFFPAGLDISPFPVPYKMEMVAENHQSCLAELVLAPVGEKLKLEKVILYPAMLDDIGEAVEGTEEQKQLVAERLYQFSASRGAKAVLENQQIVLDLGH
ncbi:CapA family protein [Planococcus shixiaomingii]|uniref:CapA family protein n=1 Tax=Planococcus shixiaomingii TaxID=3058393 RepID=UPI00260DD55F|nr:CapA family protein [Planococcus sp. N022]WKA53942.1 CapA family protein [Planococcus sp. N022]